VRPKRQKNCHSELVTPTEVELESESVSSAVSGSIVLYPLRNQQNEFYQRDTGSYVYENCAPSYSDYAASAGTC